MSDASPPALIEADMMREGLARLGGYLPGSPWARPWARAVLAEITE